MWGRQQTLKLDTFVYGLKRCLCPITFCNYKCLNIGLFYSSAVFYTSICYQSQSIHTQSTITVDTKPQNLKRCLCHITFRIYKCLNIGLINSSAVFYTSICYQSQSIHTQSTITVDTKPQSLKRCLCHITFRIYKCLNIGLIHSSAVFYPSICYQLQSIHTQPTIIVDTVPYSLKRWLCHITFCSYKCLNINLPSIVLSFINSYIMIRLILCMLTVVYFSIQQQNMILFSPNIAFTVIFSDSVITTDTVKCLQQTALSSISLSTL